MSTDWHDRRTIDALCRFHIGWSPKIDGDEKDFDAALTFIRERAKRATGTFREPTEAERHREAIRAKLETLKANPPTPHESPIDTGNKLLELFDVMIRLADELQKPR